MTRQRAINLLEISILVLFSLLLVFGLYRRGLFFAPSQTIISEITVIVGLLLVAFVLVIRRVKLTMWLLLMVSYSAYATLCCLWAANTKAAVDGALVIDAAMVVAVVMSALGWRNRVTALALLPLSGAAIYLLAMSTAFGWLHFQAAIDSNMMSSVFQYHNTFGAYELMVSLVGCFLVAGLKSRWLRYIIAITTVLSIAGMMASYSRLVWLVAAVFIVISIIFVSCMSRRINVVLGHLLLLTSGGVVGVMSFSSMSHASGRSFALSLLIVVVGATASTFVRTDIRVSRSKALWTGGAVGVVLIGALGAAIMWHGQGNLNALLQRLHSMRLHDTDLQLRFWYYGAGMKMWLDNPAFGSGAGTWATKYLAYQQFPYTSTMTHSVFVTQLINFGVIGTVLWVAVLCSSLGKFFLNAYRDKNLLTVGALLGSSALLVHSLLDFDMDFPLISIIFFAVLAMASPIAEESSIHEISRWRWVGVIVPSVCTAILGFQVAMADYYREQAGKTTQFSEQTALLQRSADYAPYGSDASFALANLYWSAYTSSGKSEYGQFALDYAQQAAKNAPWNPEVQRFAALVAYNSKQGELAYDYAKKAALDAPFRIEDQSQLLGIGLWMGLADYNKNKEIATSRWEEVLNTYDNVISNLQRIKRLPSDVSPDVAYSIDAPMQIYAATVQYCLGRYTDSMRGLNVSTTQDMDENAKQLIDVISVLDRMRLGRATTKDAAEVFIHSNPTVQTEYQLLSNVGLH